MHNANCVSRIGESPRLAREAACAGKSAQPSIDRLTGQLGKGNLNPGIGTKPIGGGISEARAADGARVYFRVTGDGTIEILGKSIKANQGTVVGEILNFLVKGSGMGTDFTYHIVGRQSWDVYDDNMDVEIVLPTGERYAATFVTVENISSLFKKNRVTGECASGSYLWVADMIIVQRLEHEVIWVTIRDLMEQGELASACERIEKD